MSRASPSPRSAGRSRSRSTVRHFYGIVQERQLHNVARMSKPDAPAAAVLNAVQPQNIITRAFRGVATFAHKLFGRGR